ncbi:MAG: glycosyltransferase family 2 protein [Lachnospiraceae bacterium]|nr:glycosyltransferase family 2 protein [Lachnospiraceae bacterium]
MDKILYIIIPAYNEEENIDKVIADWYPIVEQHNANGMSRMIIINDGSKDKTWEMLVNAAVKYPLLEPLSKANGGHGDTVLYGYKYAIEKGADYIFQTDSDGQTNPAEFEEFWGDKDRFDAIIGERSGRQDGKGRVLIENVVRFLLLLIYQVRVPDANAPFRLMKADVLKKYLPILPEHYNLPNIILTMLMVRYNERVIFKHVSFKPRQGGTNSINYRKIFKIGMRAVKDFLDIRKKIKSL